MGPKKEVDRETAIETFEEEIDDWSAENEAVDGEKKASKTLLAHLKNSYERVLKAYKTVKRLDPSIKTGAPDVEQKKLQVRKEYMKVLQKAKTNSEDSASNEDEEVESEDVVLVKNLVAEIDALEGLIITADAKLQRLYNEVPETKKCFS